MPVAIPLVGLAISAAASGVQIAQANKQRKDAQKAIDGYKRQELANPYGGLQVSTLGADRQREDLARTMSTYGNLAAMGGSRSIAATLPALVEQENIQEAQIAANLDEQQKQIDQMKAGGQSQIMQMEEQRENNDLLGYGNLLNNANQQKAAAFGQLAQAGASFAMASASGLTKGNKAASPIAGNPINTIAPSAQNYNTAPPNQVSGTLPNSILTYPSVSQFSSNGKLVFQNPGWTLGLGGQYLGIK